MSPPCSSKKATAPWSNCVPTMPSRGESEPVAIEAQRAFQVVDADGQDADPWLHDPSPGAPMLPETDGRVLNKSRRPEGASSSWPTTSRAAAASTSPIPTATSWRSGRRVRGGVIRLRPITLSLPENGKESRRLTAILATVDACTTHAQAVCGIEGQRWIAGGWEGRESVALGAVDHVQERQRRPRRGGCSRRSPRTAVSGRVPADDVRGDGDARVRPEGVVGRQRLVAEDVERGMGDPAARRARRAAPPRRSGCRGRG